MDKFRIESYTNEKLAFVVNPLNTLFIENSQYFSSKTNPRSSQISKDDCFASFALKENLAWSQLRLIGTPTWPRHKQLFNLDKHNFTTITDIEDTYIDFKEMMAISLYYPTEHMYGLPLRTDDFALKLTDSRDPYSLMNRDKFPHKIFNDTTGLYGSVPYLTTHSIGMDTGLLWANAAETWVDIWKSKYKGEEGRLVDFMSITGTMEFFLFSSDQSPKKVQKILTKLVGFAPLPPKYSLGFHFSKWE